jgi:hypothetical protein
MKRIALFFLSLVSLIAGSVAISYAASFYTAGTTGYDISYPQGGNANTYPQMPFNFGIVGVTSGRAFDDNSYLATQYSWAQQANTTPATLYMNLNAPVGSTVKGNTQTPTSCSKNDKICQAENYGYNAAAHSYNYAASKGATSSIWWLDIETGNSWSSTQTINAATIQGAINFFKKQSITTGIYSDQSMWNTIVGSTFTTPVPNWMAGNNLQSQFATLCNSPFTTNGTVYLIQYTQGSFDADYACQ